MDRCDSNAVIVLYCRPTSSTDPTCKDYFDTHSGRFVTYTHAVVYKHGFWSSKFGDGWLLTQKDAYSVDSDNCVLGHGIEATYGDVSLCFRAGNSEENAMINNNLVKDIEILYDFSQNEMKLLNSAVSNVDDSLHNEFESTYKEWVNFYKSNKAIMISSLSTSRAQGDSFKKLVQISKDHFDEIKPLLAEKLVSQDTFMSYLIYEAVTGHYNHATGIIQEVAAGYAHKLLSEIAADEEPIEHYNDEFDSGEYSYQALNEMAAEQPIHLDGLL